MITGAHSEAVAIGALRIRVWDLLVKPVSSGELSQRLTALIELTRQHWPTRSPTPSASTITHISRERSNGSSACARARTGRAV